MLLEQYGDFHIDVMSDRVKIRDKDGKEISFGRCQLSNLEHALRMARRDFEAEYANDPKRLAEMR